MHKNRINGKKYIGITSGDPAVRWQNGKGYRKNKHVSDAINKYGWDSFDHRILYSGLTNAEACDLEQKMIAKYGTQDKTKGYNITDGGEHFTHSEESKLLMSANRKGKRPPPFTDEHKRKLKEHHGGGHIKKPVLCIETCEIFESINAAARDKGINKKVISNCCRKVPHFKTAAGFTWRFMEECENYGFV